MPIRQPNGICTPAPSPASISGVAASTVTDLPAAGELNRAALAVHRRAGGREALQVQLLVDACRRPEPARRRSSMPSGPHAQACRSRQSGTSSSSRDRSRRPCSRVVRTPQPVAGVAALQLGQLGREHEVGFRWRGMQVHDVGDLVAPRQRAQHRHHRGDPGPAGDEQHRRRAPDRASTKLPCGAASRTIVPGATPPTRCVDRNPSGMALTVIVMVRLATRCRPGWTSASRTATASGRRPAVRCRRTGRAGSRTRSPSPA